MIFTGILPKRSVQCPHVHICNVRERPARLDILPPELERVVGRLFNFQQPQRSHVQFGIRSRMGEVKQYGCCRPCDPHQAHQRPYAKLLIRSRQCDMRDIGNVLRRIALAPRLATRRFPIAYGKKIFAAIPASHFGASPDLLDGMIVVSVSRRQFGNLVELESGCAHTCPCLDAGTR